MNANYINIDNIAIGLSSYKNLDTLDLTDNEYVVIGQRANQNSNISTLDIKYNVIVNNNGLGINATRNEVANNNGLYVSNDITCKGKIITNSLELLGVTLDSNITNDKLTKLVQMVSCNIMFFSGYKNNIIDINSDYIAVNNIYTPSYLTVGSLTDTFSNLYPLNIVNTGNGTVNNIQLCIQNDSDNNIEPNKIRIGIIGNSSNSPAIITTTTDMSLEFHVSRDTAFINNLYSDGFGLPDYNIPSNLPPAMIIKNNNQVGINTSTINDITFNNYIKTSYRGTYIVEETKYPNLKVNGISYFDKIIVKDFNTNTPKNIDDLYVRSSGLTLNVNQIIGGDFNADIFRFNSNLNIGKQGDNFILNVYSQANINGNLTVNNNTLLKNTIINGTTDFNDISTFNDDILLNADLNVNNNLNLDGNLFIQGTRVNISNLSYANNDFNIDNSSNITIGGKLGIGILNTDSYDHQLTINKRNPSKFEILFQDFNTYSSDSSKVFMGHSENFIKNDDNSFIIFAQKSIKWHNIYFFAGKDLYNNTKIPNLAIMQNNMVGINTNKPFKTLDVIGDIIANDYFIRNNNIIYKTKQLYNNNNNIYLNNINNLNININNIALLNNSKSLNVSGGINSYDGFYENNTKITSFKYFSENNAWTTNNIGIGCSDNSQIPLQIRNLSNDEYNNSIIRFYRGKIGGGIKNNASYSGIDICEYNTETPLDNRNKYKWYIYKYHIDNDKTNQTGPLQIGYTYNTYNPTFSGINVYYNNNNGYHIDINNPRIDHNYDIKTAMSVRGNLDVYGDVNIIGNFNFKNNGIVVGNFSNIAKDLIVNNNINNNNLTKDDITFIGKKIIILPSKTTVIGFKDDWILNNIDYIGSYNNTNHNIPLYIYQNNYNISSCKFYSKTFNFINQPEISKIELGIINQNNNEGTIINKVDFILKGYNNISIFELVPYTPENKPFITFYTNQINNYVQIGTNNNTYDNTTGELLYPNTSLHINDNSKYLLHLTNTENPPVINMHKIDNSNINWYITAPDNNNNLNISFESTDIYNTLLSSKNILTLNNNGSIDINSSLNQNYSTLNVNSLYNKSSITITNQYTNAYLIDNNDYIQIDNNKLVYYYYANFDYNKIYNEINYIINSSNLPTKNIYNEPILNYYLNISNVSIDNNIDINYTTTISDVSVDYRFLNINNNPIIIDDLGLKFRKNINIIPDIISRNPNILYEIDSNSLTYLNNNFNPTIDNYQFYNIYKIPNTSLINLTFNTQLNQLFTINNSNFYNNTINTYLNITTNINEPPTEFILLEDFIIYNNNYIYNSNIIWYNPIPNIHISTINVSINNNYYFNTLLKIPISILNTNDIYNTFDYTINNDNKIIINSYTSFLKFNINSIDLTPYILQNHLISTNNYNYLIDLDINDSNEKIIIDIPLIFNDYYTVFDFGLNVFPINISILFNNYMPHISLQNFIKYDNNYIIYDNINIHKIYSYDGNFMLYLDNNSLLSINNTGDLNTNGNIITNDITIKGNLLDKFGNPIILNLNSDIYHINTSNYLLNATNILLNPTNNGGILINGSEISDNIFQINYGLNNNDANFITLNSSTNASFMHFTSKNYNNNNIYRIGLNNNTFGIWLNILNVISESGYIDGTPDSMNFYNNAFGITYDINNNLFNYDINGYFNIINDLQINYSGNNIITIFVNPSNTYQMEIIGSLKVSKDIRVDGNILSASDIRYKKDINKIDNALSKLNLLSGYTFHNILINKKQSGLIAQEVLNVIPEVVSEDDNGYLSIAYGNLAGLIIESIKELKNDIDNIKNVLHIN